MIFRALVLLTFMLLQFACKKDDTNYLITATTSQDAVNTGMEILKNDGSAMDAALSVALSEIAVTGGKQVSFAGKLNLVYFEAKTGNVYSMNASFNTLIHETDPLSIPRVHFQTPHERIVSGRTILVPGFMKGVEEAHRRFGKIPFQDIFDHAISIAKEGIVWSEQDQNAFNRSRWIVTKYPESKAIFTKPDGTLYRVGDLFKQPELARTLERVRTQGSRYMYKGQWAKKFVSSAQKIGSKITMKDLANYEVIWSEPVHGKYQDYDIYAPGEPSLGGVDLIELLNLAELTRLSTLGHYSKSAQALAYLTHITKVPLYTNFNPGFFNGGIDLSNTSRIDKATTKAIWEYFLESDSVAAKMEDSKSEHSAAIVAVDKWGNMVSLLHSINTNGWGDNGLFVDGISIPDPASMQQGLIQRAGPGNRLPDSTIPGIVLKDGQPFLGFSCVGIGLRNQTLTSLLNILDFNMSPSESATAPAVGITYFTDGGFSLFIEPNKYSDSLISQTRRLGVEVTENPSVVGGNWTAIYRDSNTGKLHGTDVLLK